MEIREMREKRAECLKQARDINDKAEKENRNLTAEEQTSYDKAFKDAGDWKDRIVRTEAQREADRELTEDADRSRRETPKGADSPEVYKQAAPG